MLWSSRTGYSGGKKTRRMEEDSDEKRRRNTTKSRDFFFVKSKISQSPYRFEALIDQSVYSG
jgi:hypothetical protein